MSSDRPVEVTINPSELRGLRLPKATRGYATGAVDRLRELLADAVERLQGERDDLRAEVAAQASDRDRLSLELSRCEAERDELASALERAAGELQALVQSFDDASAEREALVARFEQLTRERQDAHDYTQRLEEEVARYRELEGALVQAAASAERNAHEIRSHARREAELILRDARAQAHLTLSQSEAEREQLLRQVSSLASQLETARTVLERPLNDQIATDRPELPKLQDLPRR